MLKPAAAVIRPCVVTNARNTPTSKRLRTAAVKKYLTPLLFTQEANPMEVVLSVE
jgi:hypothetical protein